MAERYAHVENEEDRTGCTELRALPRGIFVASRDDEWEGYCAIYF